MKTNQTMRVTIGAYTQQIEHKTMMGNLNELWAYGNALRIAKGLGGLDMRDWMRSAQTHELLTAIEQKYNVGISHISETDSKGRILNSIESPFIKTKRGKGGGTWVHLYLMLDAAAWLDAGFKVELYDTFIKGKLLEWRDESGDNYVALNSAIDAYLPGREGKDNKGVFIQCAILLKAKVNPDGGEWNTANFIQLKHRADLEQKLVSFLQMGFIRDFEHLKKTIDII